jgi:hypothetical protein
VWPPVALIVLGVWPELPVGPANDVSGVVPTPAAPR